MAVAWHQMTGYSVRTVNVRVPMNGARYALIRFLLPILVLPLVILVVIPISLARLCSATIGWPTTVGEAVMQGMGLAMVVLGGWLFLSSLYQVATRDEESLTLWDPPRRLVIRGAYRRVRNPMISGAWFILAGEALVLESLLHALLALAFLAIATGYIAFLDEPQLEARFGDEYRRYRQHVGRLLPRVRGWRPEG